MENWYITWKTFLSTENRKPRVYYTRFAYPVVEVVTTTIGVTLSYGVGEPVVLGFVPAGQSAIFVVEDGIDELWVTPQDHPRLHITDLQRIIGFTTIRFSSENRRYITGRELFWRDLRIPELTIAKADHAITAHESDDLVNAPVNYGIIVTRDPQTDFLSPVNSAVFEASANLGEYLGAAIYGLDKETNPILPRVRHVRVSPNGEVYTKVNGTVNTNVTNTVQAAIANTAQVTPPNYFIDNPNAYVATLRSGTVGARYLALAVGAGSSTNLATIQSGNRPLAIESILISPRSAGATTGLNFSLLRFTGAVTGGTVLTSAPLRFQAPNAAATITQQPTSVAGIISTPRMECIWNATTTVLNDRFDLMSYPVVMEQNAAYGYVLVMESTVATTVNVHVQITFREL
jgi:hypothetical protein